MYNLKRFLVGRNVLILIIGLIIVLTVVFFCWNHKLNQSFKVTEYSISTEKDVGDFRIVMVSDLHLKEYGENNSELLTKIAELNPDLIAVVGDLVIYDVNNYDYAITFLNQAAKIAPKYFSPCNHEWTLIHHYKCYEFLDALRDCDAIYLDNKIETLTINGKEIVICGAYDEVEATFGTTDDVFEQLNSNLYDNMFKLVLSHCPMTISNTKITPNADLVLSAHEHGGQIIVPFINKSLYSRNQGLFPKYTKGLHTIVNNQVIISTGLSNSYHKIPRINNQPELVVINVK